MFYNTMVKWEGLKAFVSIDRTPLYCGDVLITKGFTESYQHIHFCWILGAGHLLPGMQVMIRFITYHV
ncbi:putative alpha/Beta hydrolase [Helianthus annuus]|nr:putative alpha/Beta hydrolase [Helianthus annuus]